MNIKEKVYKANLELPARGLVTFTWGNVSGIDRERGLIVIKPSGVAYEAMGPDDMVVLDLDGNVVEGGKRPSSDTATHLALYKAFPSIGGIVHTHSQWATTWAQGSRDIPVFGTTHADYFYGSIPCTRSMTAEEISSDYEAHTGAVIIETFRTRRIDVSLMPGVIVSKHGPFTWGEDATKALEHAVVLEQVAKTALFTEMIAPNADIASQELQDKHFYRKHGSDAYYGQVGTHHDAPQ